ncbi:MAG: histidine--tRNA ligase [Bacteroidota bacterium]
MSNKPTKPKGTRDFGPKQMARRNYLINTIKDVFTRYGFLPLETPAMENLSVLTGKYGDEGDQLLFKILNSGDYLGKVKNNLESYGSKQLTTEITEKGLRYDLTVPFARYVVMNRNEITLPFRRYQIQPVWRADRPQKGRYREFMQCDADVVGTNSLLCEAEIIMMLNDVFSKLGLDGYEIAINNRKLLTGLSAYLGQPEKESQMCVAIDKLDKIGKQKVFEELQVNGFSSSSINELDPILSLQGSNDEKITVLKDKLSSNSVALEALDEIKETLEMVENMAGNTSTVTFDPALARGLSYYTGIIFEVKLLDGSMGSISGGGRYDNLTGVFGMPDIPGTGFSLGIERIYDILESRSLFPENLDQSTEVMIINFGKENSTFALSMLAKLRSQGISTELYPDAAKMKKQLSYADNNNIPYVIIAGTRELEEDRIVVKNMNSGEQQIEPSKDLPEKISTMLNSNN